MPHCQRNPWLWRSSLAILVTILLLGLGAAPASAEVGPLEIMVHGPLANVCLDDFARFTVRLRDLGRIPLGEFTLTLIDGGQQEISGKTAASSIMRTFYYTASSEGEKTISFKATATRGTAAWEYKIKVVPCKKVVGVNYHGRYQLQQGFWQATETAVLDDVELKADESGKNYTGTGQIWYTLRVWGSQEYVNCSMDPPIEATSQVNIQGRLEESKLSVSLDFQSAAPVTPAITLSCTLFDGSKVSLGSLPLSSGSASLTQLGLDNFSVSALGGLKNSVLSQGIGFTASGAGMATAIVVRLEPPASTARAGNETRGAQSSLWLEAALFRSLLGLPAYSIWRPAGGG